MNLLTGGLYKTFLNRDGGYCIVWATIQQLFVGISTWSIIKSTYSLTEGNLDATFQYISIFVASLFLVYIPNTVSVVYLQKWRYHSFRKFVQLFILVNSGKSTRAHFRDKEKFETWFTAESSTLYEQSTNIIYQLFSIVISSFINILIISMAIDLRILAWYFLSMIAVFLASHIFKSIITHSAQTTQNTRNNLSATMLSGWDNIFVGNKYNLDNWVRKFNLNINETTRDCVKYDMTRSLISSLTVSLALILICIGNGVFFIENQKDIPILAALLVTMPRQLQIIQNIFLFFNLYLTWEGLRIQFNQLDTIVNLGNSNKSLDSFIQLENISIVNNFESKSFKTLSETDEFLLNKTEGRFTIRGKNGSGKSTLLSLFAEKTKNHSFYLPSSYAELTFQDSNFSSDSDGNRIISVFKELKELKTISYIFLDEWDANLDDQNITVVNKYIDQLAKNKLIVEVRHR